MDYLKKRILKNFGKAFDLSCGASFVYRDGGDVMSSGGEGFQESKPGGAKIE